MVVAIGSVTIQTLLGDISRAQVDAVVNAANNNLWMGSGVAGALKRAGGPEIEREAIALGPIEVGEAVVTKAGTLSAQYVIHAAVMGQDLRTDQSAIRKATKNALLRARELGVGSLAFPAFGTGVGGFPPELAAEAMVGECVVFARGESAPLLKKIVFILYSGDVLLTFEKQLYGRN